METLILGSALRALFLALLVGAGIKIFRVKHAKAQKIAWSLVLFTAFVTPLFLHWTPVPNETAVVVPNYEQIPARATGVQFVQSTEEITLFSPLHRSHAHEPWTYQKIRKVVLGVYAAIAGFLFLRLLFGLIQAFRLWHSAIPIRLLGFSQKAVRISSATAAPVTIGSGVVLPADAETWSDSKLRVVLAHEFAHVSQYDFYLLTLARLYTCFFWISPLGWWITRRLADLSEAISDRAGLETAADPYSYAELLLEFAAKSPRTMEGVAMARSSNIRKRVERILEDESLQTLFSRYRRHALLVSVLLPVAIMSSTILVRVQAAESSEQPKLTVLQAQVPLPPAETPAPPPPPEATTGVSTPPEEPALPEPPSPKSSTYSYQYSEGDSFALVTGKGSTVNINGHSQGELERVRSKVQGDFLWFERNGKSYVITDPATIAAAKQLYAPMEELGLRQSELGKQQATLGQEQARLGELQSQAAIMTPEMRENLEKAEHALNMLQKEKLQQKIDTDQVRRNIEAAQIQLEKLKNNPDVGIRQEVLDKIQETLRSVEENKQLRAASMAEIQAQMAQFQSQIGAVQQEIGTRHHELGGEQAELGARQAKLGAQQAELGSQQAKIAEEANRKIKRMIDEAFKNGKAKPVD